MTPLTLLPQTLFHGADYNPDQWFFDPEVLDQDIALMKEAGCNVMSIGMFSWTTMEPEDGVFELDWLERVIDKLYAQGIYTFLSTPSGARPAWLSAKHPEVLRVGEDRVRILHGDRHNHCMTSPVYRSYVQRINGQLAARFSEHPGVLLWHISNEYSGHCHCELCQAAFRDWLREKYGTLERLNHVWWTRFWSHTYTDWSQIESPSSRGERQLHGLNLDWKRFMTDQTADFLRTEIASLHAHATHKLPTVHNFWDFVDLGSGIDVHVLAREIDLVSWDNYPIWHQPDKGDLREAAERAFIHDINRGLKDGQPFLIMESSPSAMNWQDVMKLKRPGVHTLQSIQALAHGADGISYFQWRRSLGSSEKFHGAVVDHYASNETRVFREIAALGETLHALSPIQGTTLRSKVAILYDWDNHWAYRDAQGPLKNKVSYFETCVDLYQAFWIHGISVDVIDTRADLDRYDLVLAPLLYMMPEAWADRARQFVKTGGTLLTGVWSGLVDEYDLAYRTGRPGPLRDVLGIWVEETDALYPDEERLVSFEDGREASATHMLDLIHTEGAEVLATYGDDFYEGMAAVTRHTYGEGSAYYFGFHSSENTLGEWVVGIITELALPSTWSSALPEAVVAQARYHEDGRIFHFIQNFSDEPQTIEVPQAMKNVVTDETCGSDLLLNAYGFAVLVEEPE